MVADGRNMTRDEVHAVGQGRVWTGRQALARGLVDELGGLRRAVDLAKAEAGIDVDSEVTLVPYPRPRTFFELLNDAFTTQAALASARRLTSPYAWLADAMLAPVRRLSASGPLALMPEVYVN